MVRLVLLLLGVDYLRTRWRSVMTIGILWLIAGCIVFIDALDNALYFPIEFFAYLLSALVIPPAAIVWALMERTRWAVVVVGIACLAVAVMLVRMQIIWTVQHA